MSLPLFVPFDIRNKIINENCTRNLDIMEMNKSVQLATLQCYMSENQIHEGILKQIHTKHHKRARKTIIVTPKQHKVVNLELR